jgi:hypothetical protein
MALPFGFRVHRRSLLSGERTDPRLRASGACGRQQYVQEGATLVEIDPKDSQVAEAKAEANLETAEAAARASTSMCPSVRWTPPAN